MSVQLVLLMSGEVGLGNLDIGAWRRKLPIYLKHCVPHASKGECGLKGIWKMAVMSTGYRPRPWVNFPRLLLAQGHSLILSPKQSLGKPAALIPGPRPGSQRWANPESKQNQSLGKLGLDMWRPTWSRQLPWPQVG